MSKVDKLITSLEVIELSIDSKDHSKIAIPTCPSSPGVYILHFQDGSRYVGEGSNLRKRWIAYRNAMSPAAAQNRVDEAKQKGHRKPNNQQTNIRMKALILENLRSGESVKLEIVGSVLLDGAVLDLTDKHQRKTAEAITLTRLMRQEVKILNA